MQQPCSQRRLVLQTLHAHSTMTPKAMLHHTMFVSGLKSAERKGSMRVHTGTLTQSLSVRVSLESAPLHSNRLDHDFHKHRHMLPVSLLSADQAFLLHASCWEPSCGGHTPERGNTRRRVPNKKYVQEVSSISRPQVTDKHQHLHSTTAHMASVT